MEQRSLSQNSSQPLVTETYHQPHKIRIIWGITAAILTAAAIVIGIWWPHLKLNLLVYDTFPLFGAFIIAAFAAIVLFANSFDEHRHALTYLNGEGDLDLSTPRLYTKLDANIISRILGRRNIFYQTDLKEFHYADGCVTITNSKGKTLSGPLKDLKFVYALDKNKATGEWEIYKYKISDKAGNKVQFNENSALFMPEEYDDMKMILSTCGEAKVAGISKVCKLADNVLGQIQDFDFSNIASSAADKVSDAIYEKVENEITTMVKAKIATQTNKISKKSWFRKVTKWGLIGILAIYVLAVIVVNIEDWSGASSEYIQDLTEQEMEQTEENSTLGLADPTYGISLEYTLGWHAVDNSEVGNMFELPHHALPERFMWANNELGQIIITIDDYGSVTGYYMPYEGECEGFDVNGRLHHDTGIIELIENHDPDNGIWTLIPEGIYEDENGIITFRYKYSQSETTFDFQGRV